MEELDFALVVWDGAAFCRALVEDLAAAGGMGGGFGGVDREYAALDRGAFFLVGWGCVRWCVCA